ncbi:MAG TPA: serine hydrolase [Pirellulaceae bacterium]|nr:serine hydrolase [Planctomycetales bacterium]MCB9938795.1 serine hydrolase [Planctomycetaceae bacterium]HRX77876.1 serine hydrolase [Pirellulaceae bacterium]
MRLHYPASVLLLFILSPILTNGADEKDPAEQAELVQQLFTASTRGDLTKVQSLQTKGVDIDATNSYGLTAYQGAKVRGQEAVAKWLAEHGADTERSFADPRVYVDAILKEESRPDQPGVAVLVSRDGKVLYSSGFGSANVEEKVPITSETKFRIGSVTKQFTAAAILKLQEAGKLSVQDTLDKFIPDYPRGDEVTLHHLLTHTSGIKSYTSKPAFYQDVTNPIEPEALIDSFKQDAFDFDPGQKWSYCNSGYFLLGYIVGQVSGKPYDQYLQETFFAPLGMKDTGVHTPNLNLTNEAHGYSFSDGRFVDALNWHMSRAGGAGAIYSTVEDLNRWNEGIFGGRVLTSESLKSAFTKVKTKEGNNNYGYGWFMGGQRGLRTISHGGGLQGFSSYLTRFPDQNLTIAILHNALPGSGDLEPSGLASIIAEAYLWRDMKSRPAQPTTADIDPKTFGAFVGRYDYGGPILIVTNEDNRLFAQLTGQEKLEIFPSSETKFFWKIVDAQVEFLRDKDNNVIAAQHTQGGQSFKAPRIKDEETVKLPDEVLDSYLGTYDFGALGELVVTRQGDHLAAKLASQPAFEVFPTSETEFFFEFIQAELEFTKGDDGKVEKVTLRQGGATLDGKRTD